MANHKSALKKYYRDEKRRMINKIDRSKMKNLIKSFIKKLNTGNLDEAKAMFSQVISRIDKSIGKGTIHRKTGARYKSRLTLHARKAGVEL